MPQIADNVKTIGAAVKANAAPSIGFYLDIPKGLILGLSIGAEADVGVGLSNDLFEFLGHGNANMEDKGSFKMGANNTYADLFATVAVNGGWNTKKSRLEFTATAFSSIMHFDAGDTYAKVYINDEENTVGYEANVDAKLYTMVQTDQLQSIDAIMGAIQNNIGFDVAGSYKRDIFRFLSVGASARIPIVPSKLSTGYIVKTDPPYKGEFSLDKMLGKDEEDGDTAESAEDTMEQEESEETESSGLLGDPKVLAQPYSIHRPMKIGVSADFHPFGTLLTTSGYVGLGFRHPFAAVINKANGGLDETDFYVDYSVSGRLSLWNILSLSLSHSYMDEIFKNEMAVAFNIRLVEVDAGVSFQSPSFTKSFSGAGVGAFVTVCLGF